MLQTDYNKLSKDTKETLEMVYKLNSGTPCKPINPNNVLATDDASLHIIEGIKNNNED